MKTVIEMAREVGLRSAVLLHMYGKEDALCESEIEELRRIERFAALLRADEREACALVCINIATKPSNVILGVAINCAAAIRARGQV